MVSGCSRASWVRNEVATSDGVVLTRGWQTFARARGLGGRCTLHFKYDSLATLYMRVSGEDGRRAGCFPEDGSGDDELGLEDSRDGDEVELALGDDRVSSSCGSSSSGESTSGGSYDQLACCWARIREGDGSSRRRTPVKQEEDSD